MVEPVFPEVVIGPIVYIALGFLLAVVTAMTIKLLQYRKQAKQNRESHFNLNQLNLKKSRRDVLNAVVEESLLQSELPDTTNFSKATVSQSIQELYSQGLVKKKKRGNSYLIEPELDQIKQKCEEITK